MQNNYLRKFDPILVHFYCHNESFDKCEFCVNLTFNFANYVSTIYNIIMYYFHNVIK